MLRLLVQSRAARLGSVVPNCTYQTAHYADVDLRLANRLQFWPNNKTALVQFLFHALTNVCRAKTVKSQ